VPLDPILVERALAEASKRAENLDYFFDRLTSPEWIGPLRERGFFSEPPPQVIDQGYVRAPGWSASRYLARVASNAPEEVTQTIQAIDTNNERIHEDFVEAAMAMPAEQARTLGHREAEWIAARDHVYYTLPRPAVEFAARLLELGEVDAGVGLIRVVFEPQRAAEETAWFFPRLKSRISDWDYDQLLRRVVEVALPLAPRKILESLLGLLDHALELLRPEDEDAPRKINSRWRRSIADDSGRATEVEHALVSALRDAAKSIRAAELISDRALVDALLARDDELYKRVAMHVLSTGPEPDFGLIRPLIVDPEELGDYEPNQEFRELLQTNAARLIATDRERLLEVVEVGPDLNAFRELHEKYAERPAADVDVERYAAEWRVERLHLLLPALDAAWRTRYDALVAKVGEHVIETSGVVSSFVGPTSPVSVDDLAAMHDDQLLEFLRAWEPDTDWAAPSVEGLSRTLAAFSEREPERAARLSTALRGIRPGYVQWLIQGFEGALREERAFSWTTLNEFLLWVAEQPREIPGGRRDEYADADPGWVWTRRAIVALLEQGLDQREAMAIPLEERSRVWRIISIIAGDPDPTPEHEQQFGGSNMDPATLALNTTRPRALRAAMSYSRWLYHFWGLGQSDDGAGESFFDSAPEVAALFEEHLDPERDPSLGVRAVFGQHFANLVALDRSWAARYAATVFPPEDTAQREAAWGAYVILSPPYNNVLEVLSDQYAVATELVSKPGHGFRWMADPAKKLGEHLATFYWRGVVGFDGDLFSSYWELASLEARAHVIDFFGRSARQLRELGDENISRLLTLFERVNDETTRAEASEVLSPFAWWFASESLPLDWRISQLETLLRARVKLDPSHLVVEQLPAISRSRPLTAVRLLRDLIETQGDFWNIESWSAQITEVLGSALSSQDPEAKRAAEEAAHWLGARGYRQFRSLLPPERSA